jgi:Domain of unknown function (DUF6265)
MDSLTTLRTAVCIILAFALPGTKAKQQSTTAATQAAAGQSGPAAQNSSPTLDNFAWLTGRWQGDWGPRTAEQVWLGPKAGLMVGTFRLVEDGKTLVIELFTLLQKPDGIEFRLRHFTPELVNWEKSDPTVLTLESSDGKKFVFVNQVNGQPKHAILTRIDQDTYVARSEIVPESGELQVIEITYHRQKPVLSPNGSKANNAKH